MLDIDDFSNKPKRQANFFLPESLVAELRELVPPKGRSAVVARALSRELARLRVSRGIGEYFGAWRNGRERAV
jgi:hypothetical protein